MTTKGSNNFGRCRIRSLSVIGICGTITLLITSCGSNNSSTTSTFSTPPTPSVSCSAKSSECRDVVVNGTSRFYALHVPANFVANSGALVVMLHGSGGNGFQMENGIGMNIRANLTGFAVAYPDGLVAPLAGETEWHNYFDDGIWAPQTPPDDIDFMRALVNAVMAEIHPDPKKVYFAGISNGGLFAYRVGIEMPDVVAGIGIVEGTLYGFNGNVQGIPEARAPVSVLIFHGDADTTIPYCETPQIASQEQTFNYWSHTAANQCTTLDSSAPLCDAAGNITSLVEKDATGCGGGVEVKFYRLVGGAHRWYSLPMNVPGQAPYNPDFDSTTGVTTNDILWNFFAAHSKP